MRAILLLTALILISSCKEDKKETSIDYKNQELDVTTNIYPHNISKVMDAHGGLEAWDKVNTLVFAMEKPEGVETTTTDLKSRKSLIETEAFKIGFDGTNVWIDDSQEVFKNNPKFYYNLMFYFYAMPFVLADDGISYSDAEPLLFEGKSYPGVKISYGEGVGESPEDEYILYYDAETYQMEWLGYTVTYFSKEKSKDWHFIKYDSWGKLAGLKLPKVLKWFNNEGMKILDQRNELKFVRSKASTLAMEDDFYQTPEGAKLIE